MAEALLEWYYRNQRQLPWRQRQDDPYAVWVSEIMLQQTQVATVIPYYLRWMERFQTVQALAAAPLGDVLHAWSGLGYYARARNLHRASNIIVEQHAGRVPENRDSLSSLPGIGRYTCGAILSIAFNQSEPIVDANVARVLSRLYGIDGDPKTTTNQARLWELAWQLIPDGRARHFNQAMMELGALVCSPADPACDRCPLLAVCHAGKTSDPTRWPEIAPGKRTVRVQHSSAVIVRDDRFLLVRRPTHGLWGGLWEFPRRVCDKGEAPADCATRAVREVTGLEVHNLVECGRVQHSVTHHSITLHGFRCEACCGEPEPLACDELKWVAWDELESMPLASPQRSLVQCLSPGLFT